jgi:hypothetical protein
MPSRPGSYEDFDVQQDTHAQDFPRRRARRHQDALRTSSRLASSRAAICVSMTMPSPACTRSSKCPATMSGSSTSAARLGRCSTHADRQERVAQPGDTLDFRPVSGRDCRDCRCRRCTGRDARCGCYADGRRDADGCCGTNGVRRFCAARADRRWCGRGARRSSGCGGRGDVRPHRPRRRARRSGQESPAFGPGVDGMGPHVVRWSHVRLRGQPAGRLQPELRR